MHRPNDETIGSYDIDAEVKQRYAAASAVPEASLCCATSYANPDLLKVLPDEIIEKDYGCGDPTPWARPGDTVLDLGSGGGKVCYILAQSVGETGSVIGVDFNDPMLELARKHQGDIAEKIGYANTSFRKGKIQDLALDLDKANAWLAEHPIRTVDDVAAYDAECNRLRREEPLVASDSVDLVVSNCVLNLVSPAEKAQLFGEIFRVLRKGGRAVISDVVSDEPVSQAILDDPVLWSGCIAGAFQEHEFLQRFANAGFYGMEVLKRPDEAWQTIEGIEFRGVTVRAFKGKQGKCFEHKQAVVYQGPWSQVRDDDGHTFFRGKRMAVCKKSYDLMTDPNGPYAGHMIGIEPRDAVDPADAKPFNCRTNAERSPRETKGLDYTVTKLVDDACCEPGCC
ncbi:MAG: methyltransferase domain-containing protein [Planctomycetota bacterium]